MRYLLKNIAIALIVFLVLVSLFASFDGFGDEREEVTLSAVAQEIREGTVSLITVEGDRVVVLLEDGRELESRKEAEASLTQSLVNLGISEETISGLNFEVQSDTSLGVILLGALPFLLPLLIIIVFFWLIFRQAKSGQMQAFNFGSSRAKMFDPRKERVTFKDVAGAKEAKEELKEVVDFLRSPGKFLAIGARIPRGVLLMGPPGTGKTLLARAVAGEANVPFFYISGSEFVEMFVGVGASRVRDLFKNAKKNAPAMIFVDEIDAVGRHRGAGVGGGHDEREQTLNQILSEMDGFDRDTNVIVMAATNRPDVLDPALLRPGRFDRRVIVEEPDLSDREAILNIHARDKRTAKDVNLRVIAERTPGFSGADLANLINEAAILAARKGKKEVSQDELIVSIEKVMLGPERKSKLLTVKEKEIAAYHEAAHALVASVLPNADPVHKISIVSRGKAGGYTLKLPTEEIHFFSLSRFEDELATLLAGFAAEKMIFKEVTTGPTNDIQRASKLARQVITQYGMSKKLGPIAFGEKEHMVFLGKELSEQRNYSEEVAAKIDKEVSAFVNKALKRATKILKDHKEMLEVIAQRLIEKETIEQDEFNKLIGDLAPAEA